MGTQSIFYSNVAMVGINGYDEIFRGYVVIKDSKLQTIQGKDYIWGTISTPDSMSYLNEKPILISLEHITTFVPFESEEDIWKHLK